MGLLRDSGPFSKSLMPESWSEDLRCKKAEPPAKFTLRPLACEDCESIRLWRNADLSPWRTAHLLTAEMQREFYTDTVCNPNAPHRFWAVDDGGRLAGMVGLTHIQWANRLAECNLIMAPDSISLADKAVDLLLEQAFDFLGLATVCGEYYTCSSMFTVWDDIVSRWMELDQIGEVDRTILRRRKFWKGAFYDSLYFSLSEEAYREMKGEKSCSS